MSACHSTNTALLNGGQSGSNSGHGTIALVGNPNVGKSVLFNTLTGAYVTVSNYPGTTVEVSRGRSRSSGTVVIDTPGMYTLLPISEEERVSRSVLFRETPQRIVQVIDAKNLERMLVFTLQLIEADLPLIVVVNMIDEADRIGLNIDLPLLAQQLGVPVAATVAVSGRGVRELGEMLTRDDVGTRGKRTIIAPAPVRYDEALERSLRQIGDSLREEYPLSRRAIALLLLQGDEEIEALVKERDPKCIDLARTVAADLKRQNGQHISYRINLHRQAEARRIAARVISRAPKARTGFTERLSRVMIHPLAGIPILLFILYFGLYRFVGLFGAGTLVDLLEGRVFESWLNPAAMRLFERILPWALVRDLFVGEFGLITMGLRYAVAIILPIVGTFFLAFSILEDSGYFPRLALLVDRIFKRLGLNGRAVIPMILGFGCDTMATIVTRTLETRRERVIATLLLALSVPCSAQLGVMLAVLSLNPIGLLLWVAVISVVFLLVGLLSAKLLPGKRPNFYMELPPLRLPKPSNVLIKTYTRMQWYLLEVIPLFLAASLVLWVGDVTGLFEVLVRALRPVTAWLGLPAEAARVLIFGFFRRDYGAAGLYDLQAAGLLSSGQLVVAAVTLTLFIPCVAQLGVMIKERGWKTAAGITAFIVPFAFVVGYGVRWVLRLVGMDT
ncbi:MAG: ferrous iron transport protein B [Spirochaetaceae bacterium]|nr:MAG: ferrous iron transport protein B [Spirochaetaceae bacterium]